MANEHLSYSQFKERFGDLGVTAYVKYNWLSGYVPPSQKKYYIKFTSAAKDILGHTNCVKLFRVISVMDGEPEQSLSVGTRLWNNYQWVLNTFLTCKTEFDKELTNEELAEWMLSTSSTWTSASAVISGLPTWIENGAFEFTTDPLPVLYEQP